MGTIDTESRCQRGSPGRQHQDRPSAHAQLGEAAERCPPDGCAAQSSCDSAAWGPHQARDGGAQQPPRMLSRRKQTGRKKTAACFPQGHFQKFPVEELTVPTSGRMQGAARRERRETQRLSEGQCTSPPRRTHVKRCFIIVLPDSTCVSLMLNHLCSKPSSVYSDTSGNLSASGSLSLK